MKPAQCVLFYNLECTILEINYFILRQIVRHKQDIIRNIVRWRGRISAVRSLIKHTNLKYLTHADSARMVYENNYAYFTLSDIL